MNDSLNKLYETLVSQGLYTKSLDDFKEQYKDGDYKKKVFDVVSRDGLYTKDFNSFSSKYSVEDEENKEKEEEETTKYKSDIDVTEYFSKNPETQKQKDFSYFDKDFDKINEDIGGLFGDLEETVVKDLDRNFKKWGFTFEEAEAGSDAIKVISTKDPDINKTFSLDDPNQGMYAIKSFIDKNKRDNAVYAEEIKDIDVSDNYMQDLFKATSENDEEKKNKLLQGISRKIYASEGVSYDEVKNLESRGKTNQNEIDFINNNLLKRKREFDPEIGQMIEFGKESVLEYKASKEEIEKYPNIFNQEGDLKVDPLKYQTKLEKQNERFSDVTASDVIYKVKVKEKLLFDKFKNKESVKIIDQSKEISEKTLTLSSEFKKITGLSIDNFEGVNAGIESNINSLESELKQVAGVGFSDINSFKPNTEEEANQVKNILDRYNTYYSQTIAPVNQIYQSFSTLGDKQRQISNVGNTINSMLSFDDLHKYRGQYEDSKFKSILNNAESGWRQGKVNSEFLKAAYGVVDPSNEEEIAGIAKNVAEEISLQKGLLTSETWERYQNAGTVAEQLKILGTDPGEVLLSLFGNSMGMFASTGKNVFLPIVGGSATIGGGIGATAGGVGAIPGAISGLGYGLTAWQTITGFNMELGSAYSEELTKAGYDLSDAEQVVAGLRDSEVVAKANERGIKRGIPIAVANFIGSRAAGALVNPLATTSTQVAQQFGKGMLLEPLFEGGGELFAQIASDGDVVGTEILNEMIGGMPGTQANIAVKLAKNSFIDTQLKQADKLNDLNYMSDKNYGYNDVRAFTNRLLNNKKINQDQANKIIENARIVDETNSLMRNSPKLISGKRRKNARNRISDLIQTRNLIEKAAKKSTQTGDLLGKIETEINQIADSGKTLESSDITTIQDYSKLITRTAQVGAEIINKKLNSNIEVINFNKETAKSLIKNNPDVFNAIKKDINDQTPGFITPEINGKQYIVVNDEVVYNGFASAITKGDVTAGNVVAHEVLHAVLDASFDEKETIALGKKLEEYVLNTDQSDISDGSRKRIKNKLNQYKSKLDKGEYSQRDYYQEVFTTLSDEMQQENIDFNRQDRAFWQSIADYVNDLVYKNKNTFDEKIRGSIKLKTAEDAFNFVKDYNRVYKKGRRISKSKIKAKAPIVEDKVRKSIITKGEDLNDFINSKMTKDQFQTKRTVDVNGRMMTPFDAAYTAVNGPVFDKLIGARVKYTKGISREDFIQSVKDNLSNLLVTFDPQQNDNLFAWVNSQVTNKIGTVSKKQGPKTVSTDKTIDESGRTLADTLKSEELDVEARSLQEAKEVFTLTDKIELSKENNKIITNEVAKVNFTKLPNPSEQITKNKTVTPFVSELKQAIGKTASGSLSKASRAVVVQMGKKGEYVPYLRKNLPFIIKKLPIGYLAKNMPSVVMKSVGGVYTSNWQGKNVDKYTQAETGMSSQPQKMKLKPNINKEDINDIISKFAKANGSPVQNKQEGLAYQIASEIGLEKFANSLLEDNKISKSFKISQELLERPDPNSIVGKMTSDIERGIKGVRYTILQTSPTAFIAANTVLPSIINKISSPSLNAKEASTLIKKDLKFYIKEALQDEINLDNPSITSIVNKITDIVTKARTRAINAYSKQFKVGPIVDIEAEILKGLEFDFESPGVISFFNLDQSMSDIFKSAENVNDLRRSFLEQAKQEIEAGRDPLDVIKDFIKWDGDHLKSSSKIGDGQFTISNNKNDLGQNIVIRDKNAVSGKTNRAQVFENVQDFIDNLLNLISDKYEATSTTKGIIVKETATGVQINLDTTTPAQKSKNVINEIKEKGEKATYKNRLNFANEARARIKARMEYLKKKNNPIISAMTMASFKSNMKAILRAAANAEYIFVGDLNTDEKIVYEHLTPAEVVVMLLLDTYFGKGNISVDEIFKNYHVALIPESMDNILKEFGFQQTMPKGFLQDLSKFLQRYYNDLTYGSVQYAVKSLKDGKVNELSQEFATAYKLNNNEETTKANRKSLLPSGIVPGNESNINMVDASMNMTSALDNSIKNNAPVKKIRVFDFDDTLAKSKSLVFYNKPNKTSNPTPKRKAIFMIGGPGSGKSNIGKGLQLGRDGWKVVNQDIFIESEKTKQGLPEVEKDYTKEQRSKRAKIGAEGRKAAEAKMDKYTKAGNGMVIDGTGASYNATMKKVNKLKAQGYEVFMVYAKTSNEVALERNKARKERSLPDFIVEKTQQSVNNNINKYKKDLGGNFLEINTETIEYGKSLPKEFVNKVKAKVYENERGVLNAEEFARDGKSLVDEGAVMDFTDFNIVREGEKGPMFKVAEKIRDARGTDDVFVLTARAPESQQAIHEFLKSEGLNIPLKNITGLGNSTGEAKAQWLVSKAAEGYNDFYFADDAFANIKAVKDALAPLDIKSKIQQAKTRYSILSNEFNDIIEKNTGIEAFKEYSAAKAKTIGANKGNFKFWIPYSAEDFMGLIYPILGKGSVGDKQMAWFKENTIRPYTKAMESLSKDRINLMADFKALKKQLNIPKIIGKKNKSGFTNEQAVRVYIWNKQGFDMTDFGLSKTDLNDIVKSVEANKTLKLFADQIQRLLKGDVYSKPTKNWLSGTITTDLIETLNKGKRAKYLQQWQANIDSIFNKTNLNKLEAIYGSKYREALENVIARMKAGSNRLETGSRLSNRILDYINGSVGAIMFFNTRSAILQTISSINFVNWSFNNPLKAGAAFANQSQYWKDFSKIINSDYLVDRRNGQKIDINESEIKNAAATSKNKAKAAINYLLQKGFLPTQIADSFAIAMGGATYYRNRISDLTSKGTLLQDAEKQAMLEFREIAEESQQSSDPSRISQQQASSLGRVILAFANTPMQYARLTKRAYQDLIKGRGDAKSNISKIIYYTFVQNVIFNALQQSLFALGFGDDEEDNEKREKKYMDIANGMLDTQLRGLGIGGAAISVIKNFLTDLYKRSGKDRPEYVDAVWKLMQFSPPISSKISKLRQAAWQFDSKARREEIYEKGFSINNPAYKALSKVVSATTNVPLDRLYSKGENIEAALSDESDWWQKVAMMGGWPEWQIMDKSKDKKNKFKKPKFIKRKFKKRSFIKR